MATINHDEQWKSHSKQNTKPDIVSYSSQNNLWSKRSSSTGIVILSDSRHKVYIVIAGRTGESLQPLNLKHVQTYDS